MTKFRLLFVPGAIVGAGVGLNQPGIEIIRECKSDQRFEPGQKLFITAIIKQPFVVASNI